MDTLLESLSDAQIEEALVKYKANPSVVTLLTGIKAARVAAQTCALAELERVELARIAKENNLKALDTWANGNHKGQANLPHGDTNHYQLLWKEVDDTSQPEEVEVEGVKVVRYPKVTKWVASETFVTQVPKGKETSGSGKSTKRAITVFKREGTNLVPKGHFASATKACDHLKLTIGGDSAMRVLAREGYITEPYDGSDFTS